MTTLDARFRSALAVALCVLAAACSGPTGEPRPQAEVASPPSRSDRLEAADHHRLQSVGDVHLSPDGSHVAYAVVRSDGPGVPTSDVRIMNLATGDSTPLAAVPLVSHPRWSPDGRSIAFLGGDDSRYGVYVGDVRGGTPRFIAPVQGTNHPLPATGDWLAWSPDGRQLAFVSATPGPEADANGDPMVITRYLYKPPAANGERRFNDNRRLHIFVVDAAGGTPRQLTNGVFHEHSIAWSPAGDRILFISNRERDPDRVFNDDIFTIRVGDGSVTQLTRTQSAEYQPVWSADGRRIAFLGTTRPRTSSETTMEDTHVWIMDADGNNRVDAGRAIDNRQGSPRWSSRDGGRAYFTVQERGARHLYRVDPGSGAAEPVLPRGGSIQSFSLADTPEGVRVAYALADAQGPPDLYVRTGTGAPRRLTELNRDLLAGKKTAAVEAFTFKTDDGLEVEAFLTKPIGLEADGPARHPMIVIIHGGPHGQQGADFDLRAQLYAARGWASLMVNYRGSTGYGQKFADAIFGDQNGAEARDVLAGVDAALRRYPWIDPARLGVEGRSYGGQLTNWIITRTTRFAAAIPTASISNLVTQNYLSYYHDYLAVEFGRYPHEQGLIDLLWERSPIRYAHLVRTPTMFLHGDDDNNVPVAEAEQFYIALKDVGVDTVLVRYPREGHGFRESKHIVDAFERSMNWYEHHFTAAVRTTH